MRTEPEVYILDAGALIAVERADPLMARLLLRVRAGRARLIVPEAVVAQVWRTGTGRQARLSAVLGLKADRCRSIPLDRAAAKLIGRGIARSGHADIVDVQVALLAREHRAAVLTSDRADLLAVAPDIAAQVVDI